MSELKKGRSHGCVHEKKFALCLVLTRCSFPVIDGLAVKDSVYEKQGICTAVSPQHTWLCELAMAQSTTQPPCSRQPSGPFEP